MRCFLVFFAALALFVLSMPDQSQAAPPRFGGQTMTLLVTEPEDSQTAALYSLIPEFLDKVSPDSLQLEFVPGLGGAKAWHTLQRRRADGSQMAAIVFPAFLLKPLAGETYFTQNLTSPVCILASAPLGLWVPDTSPAHDVSSLLQQIRADSTQAYLAGVGSYTAHHMATLFFNRAAGVTTEYLPFMGSRESSYAAQTRKAIATWGSATHHSLMPGMRLIAVAGKERSPIYPGVPTLNECGILMEISQQYGLGLPSKSPLETMQAASDLFVNIVSDRRFMEKAHTLGFAITPAPYDTLPELLADQKESLVNFSEHFLLINF